MRTMLFCYTNRYFFQGTSMTEDNPAERISRLEMLFSEQEYTIETLNTIVTRQNDDIQRLITQVEHFKTQLRELKQQLPGDTQVNEKPPHY